MSPLLGIAAVLFCVVVATFSRSIADAVRRAAGRHIKAEPKPPPYANPSDATTSFSFEKRRDASSRRL